MVGPNLPGRHGRRRLAVPSMPTHRGGALARGLQFGLVYPLPPRLAVPPITATSAAGILPRPRQRCLGLAAPQAFYSVAGRLLAGSAVAAALFAVAGLVLGLLVAPTDLQQGDAYRIVFVHVPAAWMSMLIYAAMAFSAGIGLLLNTRLPSMLATALAPTGALMTLIALWTGALWSKPTWGAWWAWDARLAAELMLLLLYLGFMALQASTDDRRRAEHVGAAVVLVGVVIVPATYCSVQWWNTPDPNSSATVTGGPGMAGVALAGMLLMLAAFCAYSMAAALHRLRSIILEREKSTDWVQRLVEAGR